MQKATILSVVIPVYNSAATLTSLVASVIEVLQTHGMNGEIILVDDGSQDASWDTITAIAAGNPAVAGIRLRQNMGQHAATIAGLQAARAPAAITMDDDAQHPPDCIPALYKALTDDANIVYAVPEGMRHSLFYYISTGIARRLLTLCSGNRGIGRMQTFRLLRTGVYPWHTLTLNRWLTIEGLLASQTVRAALVHVRYRHSSRGVSTYSFLRLSRLVFLMCLSGLLKRPLTCPADRKHPAIAATAGWLHSGKS